MNRGLQVSSGIGLGKDEFISGKRGEFGATYHLNFDGMDDKIVVPASTSLDNLSANNFTIDFSAKINFVANRYFLKKGAPDEFDSGIVIANGAANKFSAYLYYSSGEYAFVGLLSNPNFAVHHYEFVFQSSIKTFKVFIDGVEAIYQFNISATSGAPLPDAGYGLWIMNATVSGGGTRPENGDLYWLRISNYARHISNFIPPNLSICPPNDANTVLRLALNEGNGNNVVDTSGNNNRGVITGATWIMD